MHVIIGQEWFYLPEVIVTSESVTNNYCYYTHRYIGVFSVTMEQ